MLVSALLKNNPLVPVVVLEDERQTIGLVEALLEGGMSVIEVTMRNDYALDAMSLIKKHYPQMCVLAGTVISVDNLKQVQQIGVDGVVTPGVSESILSYAQEQNIALLPGVANASNIITAIEYGFTECKLFPASLVGGVDILNAFAGPFSQIKFCPTGGINQDNFLSYLALDNVFCVGGSWMIDKQQLISQNWELLSQRIAKSLSYANQTR